MEPTPAESGKTMKINIVKYFTKWHLTIYLCAVLLVLLFPRKGMAQQAALSDSVRVSNIQHEVGFSGGLTIGSGMAYRVWLKNFGTQVSFAPAWKENSESYFLGVSFYLLAFQSPSFNFFLYQGNNFMSTNTYTRPYSTSKDITSENYYPASTMKNRNWNNGFGIGYEIFRGPGKFNPFGLSMMVGWAAYKNFTETNITGEITLLYKFNRNAHLQQRKLKK